MRAKNQLNLLVLLISLSLLSSLVILFDLAGFTMSCMDYEVVKMLVNTLQYNYPETLKVALLLLLQLLLILLLILLLQVALIVNAPMLFSACWMIIKGWLDPVTAAKVKFVNLQQLEQYIDKDSIPIDLTNPSVANSRNASQLSLNGSENNIVKESDSKIETDETDSIGLEETNETPP